MKGHLIIINWILSVLFLTYPGKDIGIGLLVFGYFILACVLIKNNWVAVYRAAIKFNNKIDKIISYKYGIKKCNS